MRYAQSLKLAKFAKINS
jgi:hypothetical protein